MKTYLKIVIWFAAAFIGLFFWNVTSDFRPLLTWIITAAIVGYLISIIVETTVKRVVSNEQQEVRSRLELLDRKVTALLKNALEQRRGR